MPTTFKPDTLPEFVGRYRVVERIGKGAMGVVYSALDEQLGRKVAVKLMLADFEEEPEMRERFYAKRKSPASSPTATSSRCSTLARTTGAPTS